MGKNYDVIVTESAERDLEELDAYVAIHDASSKADAPLDHLMTVVERLRALPDRGTHPPELRDLGVKDFREVFFKPYRIIYRIVESRSQVVVLLIVDGRRDMLSVLSQRLLAR